MSSTINPNEILKRIHRWVFTWIGILSLMMIAGTAYKFSILYLQKGNPTLSQYDFINYDLSEMVTINLLCGSAFTLVLLFFINGANTSEKSPQVIRSHMIFSFMILSTLLLGIYIFLSGGFLNSPISPSLSIFIGGFIVLQERTVYKKLNICLILFSIAVCTAPYIISCFWLKEDSTFLTWKADRHVTFIRYSITISLTIFTIYQANNVNKQLSINYDTEI